MNDHSGTKKKIGLFSCVLFGLAVLFPIAPVPIYGVVQPLSMGHMALCYMIAAVPMTFTAWSFGMMGAEFPKAGSSYTFVSKGIHPYAGFTTGWTILLDYGLFPLMNYICLAIYACELFPALNFKMVIIGSIILICIINLLGIKSIASVNNILTIFGFLVIVYFTFCASGTLGAGGGMGFTSTGFINPETFTWTAIMTGTSIACFSFMGFDTITTLAEEVKSPEKTLPKATVITCLIVAVIFAVVAFLSQCVYPDFSSFDNPDAAFMNVAMAAGGKTMANLVSLAMVACSFAFSLDMMAGVTRLLFGMGRDGVLPRKFFGYEHPKTKVPVYNVILVTVFCILGCNVSLGDLIPVINFGGLMAFVLVNLSVVRHFYFKKGLRDGIGNKIKYLLCPGFGFITCTVLWLSLPMNAKIIGGSWLLAGIIYCAVWSKGFKKPMKAFDEQ